MKRSKIVILTIALLLAFASTSLGFTTIAIRSIKLSSANVKIEVGKTYTLKVTITPANATNKKLNFSSGNNRIATIDKNGKIKGIKPGKTLITVTSVSNKKAVAKCNVTISQVTPPVKLVFYYPNTVSADDQLVNNEVNKILLKAINATVKLNVVDWGAYTEKMNMIIAAQEPYDICFTASWANPPTQRILNGAYSQIDPLFQYAPKLKELVPAYLWGITKYRGKIYTIPNYQFNSMSVAYYIQKRFIDKYGFNINSVPKEAGFETLKALEPLLEKIKNGEPGIYPLRQANYGFGLDPENPNGGVPAGLSGGLVAINPTTGKAFNYLTTAWNKATKAKMHELYLKGYIRKDIASVTDDQADMDNNKYAFTAGAYYPGAEDTFSSKVEVVAVPLMKGIIAPTAGTETMLAISRTSKNPDKAIMFIQELWTNSNLKNTIIFGIEGTHYKKIADNQIEFIKDSKYQQNAAKWEMGTVFNSYLTSSEKPGIYEKLLAMEKVAESSKLSGFTFDPSSIKTELAQLAAVEQEINSLSKGQLDPESYMPKMLDKVEKAGVQKVIDEVQKQYDEWLKTK